MICGPCAMHNHADCNGFCKTSYEFCRCADRAHQPVVSDAAREVRERNDAIVREHIARWFKQREAR